MMQFSGIISDRWQELGDEDKKKYEDMAVEDKARYEDEVYKWQLCGGGEGIF